MPAITRAQLMGDIRQFLDGETTVRWPDALVRAVATRVYDAEWSNILNAAPYYTFATYTVTTDADGKFPFSALNSGTGDAQKNFYRIMAMTDGSTTYTETRFQDVPLGVSTNYARYFDRLYYLVGSETQVLPPGASIALTVSVNYKPTSLNDLASDTSTITFPDTAHLIIAYQAASELMRKGGTESTAANVLQAMAAEEREKLLDDLRRRTIQPTRMAYSDARGDWVG